MCGANCKWAWEESGGKQGPGPLQTLAELLDMGGVEVSARFPGCYEAGPEGVWKALVPSSFEAAGKPSKPCRAPTGRVDQHCQACRRALLEAGRYLQGLKICFVVKLKLSSACRSKGSSLRASYVLDKIAAEAAKSQQPN